MNLLKKLLRNLPAVLGLALLCGAIYVVQKEFRNLKIADIKQALGAIPHTALALSFGWTVLSYGVLTFYDRLGTIYAGNPVSYRRVAFASFCAYSLSHNLGFAAVSGAAVRYRLYSHWGLTALQIGKVVAFCSLTFGLGAGVLGGIILFTEPEAVPFFGDRLPVHLMYAIGALMWLLVALYITMSKILGKRKIFGHEVELPHWRMALLQVLLASVDVAITAAIMHALLPAAPGLNYMRFLGVYLASYSAGLVANVPGGLGVFDTAMLLGLSPYLEPPTILGAVVVFRLYYYIIPLFLAGSLFTGNEIILRGRNVLGTAGRLKGFGLSGLSALTSDFAVAATAAAVGLCGGLLLSLGAVGAAPDISWIDPDFAVLADPVSEFVPSLMGAALIVLALKMVQRVTLAWGATIVVLLGAAVFCAVESEPWWIGFVLAFTALLLAPFRSGFYRRSSLFSGPMRFSTLMTLLCLALCIVALAVFGPALRSVEDDSWWNVLLRADVPNSVRASVALTVGLGLVALARLLRPGHIEHLAWDEDARQRYAALGGSLSQMADGVVFGENGRAAIAYRRVGAVLLAMGDPVGAPGDQASAIWRLRDLATEEGREPAIWDAGTQFLRIYADLGLSAVRLAEDGGLAAPDAAVTGAERYLVCRAERHLQGLLPHLPSLGDLAVSSLPVSSAQPGRDGAR